MINSSEGHPLRAPGEQSPGVAHREVARAFPPRLCWCSPMCSELSPAELEEVRRLIEKVKRGDYSDLVPLSRVLREM